MQVRVLRQAGVHRVYEEKKSAVRYRPQFERLLAELMCGDVLVVYKLDRIARSLAHLLSVLECLKERGAGLRSLTEPIDTSSPAGLFTIQVLGAAAQFERALIHERCEAGRQAARARGVRFGRAPLVDGAAADAAVDLYGAGFTVAEIAALYQVSDVAIRRALRAGGAQFRGRAGAVQRGPLPLLSGEVSKEAAVMYCAGYSIDETARAFGVSPSAARRALLREGVVFRVRY